MSQFLLDENREILPSTNDIAAIAEMVKGGLQQIFAEKARDPFSVSPATEKHVQILSTRWDMGDFAGLGNMPEYSALLSDWSQRRRVDYKYADALARLDDLNVECFRLRYGKYFASGLEEFQRTPRHVAAPDGNFHVPLALPGLEEETLAFFNTHEWSEIWKRLRQEPSLEYAHLHLDDQAAEASPIVRLIQVLAGLNDIWVHRIIEAIQAYVALSGTAHKGIAELAATNSIMPFTGIIEDDLRDLSSAPAACTEAVPAIRDAIFVAISRYYTLWVWEEDSRRCLGMEWRGDSLDVAAIGVIKRADKDSGEPFDDFASQFSQLGLSEDESQARADSEEEGVVVIYTYLNNRGEDVTSMLTRT
ncbi:hypothetical protein BBK36DRAFT_1118593 [Trichoderma citrinoviride]|uniref:Uncharacterized protein n=1 Tax=Trichoderma citrinoviride TaxID=58853 RepID=A0A2T4BAN7_9HYPO|nr:hypothetical protein BBK36DRAFT_1118593 [Trichoderma citrinoviride]PTB66390.1 hypothetical protein BBK36DRAFT_1118593 [Trichoderma citrinoviride]